ncbi:oligosaccharide repeat unit polymerase, partial [Escherichia coli]|uniref:oligosaccharide repeat unit polymerase n=1 Tax=Escherichia coli TaxID=562 RepID=UPI00190A3986
VISFLYCLLTDQFNGDFFPLPVFVSPWLLATILGLCLLPYVVSWQIAQTLERIRPKKTFQASYGALTIFLLVGSLAHIAVTALFGVGVMDREVYTAPAVAVPFIQIINRLDPFYLGVFYILATPKRPASDLLALALMVTIGLLRAGLGVFNYALIAMVAKYSIELLMLARRAPWLSLLAASVLPVTISALYQLRGLLRGDMQIDLNLVDMLFGRFFGRLSSFSNVTYVIQNEQSFVWSSRS